MSEIILTEQNFDAEVKASPIPVLVDFWASWCGPCKMLAPIVDQIAQEYEGKIKVGKVNVDDESDLAGQFDISAIPTVLLFKGGEVVGTSVGLKGKPQLCAMIDAAL